MPNTRSFLANRSVRDGMSMSKTCPFHQGFEGGEQGKGNLFVNAKLKKCDGLDCQLWVKLMKDRILVTGKHSKMTDPDSYYVYEGCGLVTAIPWMLVNRVKKP